MEKYKNDFLTEVENKLGIIRIIIDGKGMTMDALEFLNSEILGFYKMSFIMIKMNFIKVEQQRQSFILKTPKKIIFS